MNIMCNRLKILFMVSVLLLGLGFGEVNTANATIIDLNARSTTTSNPVSIDFAMGTYDVVPIGIADGGVYDAWNAWGNNMGCSAEGSGCTHGWINKYSFSSSEFSTVTILDGNRYATPSLALANAISTTFTLTHDATVNFFISDYPYWDNVGGMSLNVTEASVPEPGTMILAGFGLLGLLFWKRWEMVSHE